MRLRTQLLATFAVAIPAMATPLAAHAQSSVVIYGRLDGGFQWINHLATGKGGTVSNYSAEGGDWGTSILGFKGTEDMGGGLSAIFKLETAPEIMNGTVSGGRLFSRRAFVGLDSDQWGLLQAGRNLFIDSDGVWEFDPMVQEAFASASLVRGRNWQQTNNNVEYHSPVIAGFDIQGQYAFGNQTNGFNNGAPGEFGRSDGVMLTYHSKLFEVRGIYDELRDANGQMTNIFTSSREYFAGVNVNLDRVKIQGAYTHFSAPDTPAGIADSANYYWLGATYTATQALAITLAGFYVSVGDGGGDAQHDPSGHATMYTLGSTYNLSKRTFLYGTVAYVDNGKQANFSLLANPREGSGSTSPLQGESQTGAYVGILHQF
ncbi:porin [Paraburkholderia sp. DHOC27]|uniref:porin n=1 Tax=Paraburkholderia sp. DHOC27 TaxID=2303330 RepID=UPI000E3CFFB9|nr:porin [Paraburkholderia sp. DHOC27]RFU49906.1 porin [Paraburkholderia sp. DHOC27]